MPQEQQEAPAEAASNPGNPGEGGANGSGAQEAQPGYGYGQQADYGLTGYGLPSHNPGSAGERRTQRWQACIGSGRLARR